MIFTLEALQARQGDALLLHFGTPGPDGGGLQLVVIDGGPAGVYDTLKERLDGLRKGKAPLPIRLMMVSHIDDDHIRGILDLTDELVALKDQGGAAGALPYDITTLWHNSFEDVVGVAVAASAGSVAEVTGASLEAEAAELPVSHAAKLVLANVAQGRRLRDNAARLGLNVNRPFGDVVCVPSPANPVRYGALTLTVVGPSRERIAALRADWDKQVAKLQKEELKARAAAYVDDSVYNLSSIVVLAECGGKRMLLTGDARGDYVLEGLREAGLLDAGGSIHVDLLKLPHHGSEHNVEAEFFHRVTADHYVISANGMYKNPDVPTLRMLTDARGDARYTIHLTNPVPHAVEFFAADQANRAYAVQHRGGNKFVRVDLLDPFSA